MLNVYSVTKKISRVRILWPISIFMLAIFHEVTSAQEIKVTGQIFNEVNEPVSSATVRFLSGNRLLVIAPEPVDLSGRFQVQLSSLSLSHLTCEVTALGFETTKITVVVRNNTADAGIIKIKKKQTLKLSSFVCNTSSDAKYYFLDVFAMNDTSNKLTINKIKIAGSFKSETGCSDPSPTLIFEIADIVEAERTTIATVTISSGTASFKDRIRLEGHLTFSGCDQIQIDVSIPWLFYLSAGDHQKLRIVLPREMSDKKKVKKRVINLEKWDLLVLELRLEDGSQIAVQKNNR